MHKLIKSCVLTALFAVLPVSAVTPSPAMMAQFQNLSPAEQQRLAQQYGIELPTGMLGNSSSVSQAEPQLLIPQQDAPIYETVNGQLQIKELTQEEIENQRFGMKMFNAKVSTFAPIDNAPVPENYRLGPDDVLLLQLFGKQNDSVELIVSRNGTVVVPAVSYTHLTLPTNREV